MSCANQLYIRIMNPKIMTFDHILQSKELLVEPELVSEPEEKARLRRSRKLPA